MKATDPVGKIPVTLITGFLGSGKTTLLRAMLARDELAGSAVLINEFGEIAIDDSLVRSRAGEVITLESGCLCCSLRDGLAFTLRDLVIVMRKHQVNAPGVNGKRRSIKQPECHR